MLNPDVTTGEWRRRKSIGNVAAVRREIAVIGSLGKKEGFSREGEEPHYHRTPQQP